MMKPIVNIDFKDIESIPSIIKDFLNGKIGEEFLFSKQNFERQIQQKEASFSTKKRHILVEVLKTQMERLDLLEQQKKNIDRLKYSNTFTVVTGHQLNLFSGPVFFIYKILQTIKTAEYLNKSFKTKYFVPLFWMATEDHDFEEINHFKTKDYFYQTNALMGKPVGRIKVQDLQFITQFEVEFKDSVFGTELIQYIKVCYKEGETFTNATRKLVNYLFSKYGLLILDGDDVRLKQEMKSVFQEELLYNTLYNSTNIAVNSMREQYGKVQVNPRAINLFYIKENRERIDADGENFRLSESNYKFTRKEILKDLENNPENFSPNALMRPIYQESVLPNVAYIGGNAEVAYWIELQDYFKQLALPFPVLVPRNSMLFLSQKTLMKIEKVGLRLEDFFGNFANIIQRELLLNSELLTLLNDEEDNIKSIFFNIKNKAVQTEKTFENLVNAEKKRQLKSFERMKKRLLRAEKIKQKEKIDHLERLFIEVHPAKNWQERVYNFSVFYSDEGHLWLEKCYEAIQPTKSELIVMEI